MVLTYGNIFLHFILRDMLLKLLNPKAFISNSAHICFSSKLFFSYVFTRNKLCQMSKYLPTKGYNVIYTQSR